MYNLIERMFGLTKSALPNKAHSLVDPAVEDDARRVRQEISAIAARFQDALAKKALSEVLDIVTDDVVLLTASGAPTVGRTAVEALCLSLFRRFDFAERPVSELHGAQAIGNVAITGGGYLAKLSPIEGGGPAIMRGRIVVVFRNEDGAWRLSRGLTWATWVDDSCM